MIETGKRVTIKDLASVCGVSTATVSRVLNHISGGYSGETEAMVLETAEKLGYAPNPMARSLVTRQTGLIAVLVPDIHYYFFQDFLAGLEEYFNRYAYRILLCDTQGDQSQEDEYVRSLSNGFVDGMIISTLNGRERNENILKLQKKHFPVIALERYGEELKSVCRIQIDNCLAGKMAVHYLYQRGHRRIAFIQGGKEAKNAGMRYKGYCEGMKQYGMPLDETIVECGNYDFYDAFDATGRLLKKVDFTALITANDLMMLGACNAIARSGRRIPEDISVLGLDRTMLTDTHEPAIVAVDFCARQVGQKAAEKLLGMIQGECSGEQLYIQTPKLFEGKSVRKL